MPILMNVGPDPFATNGDADKASAKDTHVSSAAVSNELEPGDENAEAKMPTQEFSKLDSNHRPHWLFGSHCPPGTSYAGKAFSSNFSSTSRPISIHSTSDSSRPASAGHSASVISIGSSHPSPAPEAYDNQRNGTQETSSRQYTIPSIVSDLARIRPEVRHGHSALVSYMIESTEAPQRHITHGADIFANPVISPVSVKDHKAVKIKFKQHLKNKKDHREAYFKAVGIKTNKKRVPVYRFHHVEIKKNVLTPNTMLTFVPHLRDLESYEETKYDLWLKELEDFDLKSGFKPMKREDKIIRTIQSERARTFSLYLERWLRRLAMPGCTKSSLIRHMASAEPDDEINPRQKTDILNTHDASDAMENAAAMFTEAFRRVFESASDPSCHIKLKDVLLLDESVEGIMDSKPLTKDPMSPERKDEDETDATELRLASYCILGCLICFSHSCEHGEYDNQNFKHTFSLSSSRYRLKDLLATQLSALPSENGAANERTPPCTRQCYRSDYDYAEVETPPLTKDEMSLLRSICATTSDNAVQRDPFCLVAGILGRKCYFLYREYEKGGFATGHKLLIPPTRKDLVPRNLSWYDRFKKALLGDWQDHTVSHEYQKRELVEPCFHEGACAPKICSCVDAGILCEKFCGCTVKSCAYKFTGCACHGQGKLCQRKPNEKSSCICIQLNRECDPLLCVPCRALERADPENTHDDRLHSTGCQNCVLQRGLPKTLLLGQSQLEGVGYGLFTAEDIAQDDFIVEYVGELIFHDEGVRREARRGDVFDEESTTSYLFTLLENEGIWVDAAIYGNLSRYINHAPESEKRGCNITPRILYVNGEFRIKFTALRDIKAGEELFFNYGDEFPNLTKKLLDEKANEKSEAGQRKKRQATHAARNDKVARKATKADVAKPGKPRTAQKDATPDTPPNKATGTRKRKRALADDDSDEDEYMPIRKAGIGEHPESSESGDDGEGPSAGRLRRRNKAQFNSTSTPPGADLLKPKSKRGGARPGSGRPRKYPRPGDTAKSKAAKKWNTSPSETIKPRPGTNSKRPSPSPSPAVAPAADADAPPPTGATPPQRLKSTPPPRSVEPVRQIDDSEDDAGADDDDDQDVVVRKRAVRASRNRRPPAKFRDDEMWS